MGLGVGANVLRTPPPRPELIEGDLKELDAGPGLAGRAFDRILFLQSSSS